MGLSLRLPDVGVAGAGASKVKVKREERSSSSSEGRMRKLSIKLWDELGLLFRRRLRFLSK